MQYKIIVDKQPRTNPSQDKKEYTIDIEELRYKGDVHDTLVITHEEDYVMRRLSLSKYHVLSVLPEPIKEPLEDVNIELFEGENYIYISDMTGNKFYAEYLIKNDFTDLYVIDSEMKSAINESAKSIELSVNQKLTNYSTTEEMNALIQLISNQILLEVAKKVGNDEIIAKLNLAVQDEQGVIELIGNIVKIVSDNFQLTEEGNLTCNNATMNNINVSGGSINIIDQEELGDVANVKVTSYDETYEAYYMSNGANFYGDGGRIFIDTGVVGPQAMISVSDGIEGTSNATLISNGNIRAVSVTQTSLEEHKKNFSKLENALDIIKAIDIYKYNLKFEDDKTKKHIGFVIGDKYKYSEDVTSSNNDGVDIYSFVSVCCKAIQEQQEKIENLEARLARLEEKINETK